MLILILHDGNPWHFDSDPFRHENRCAIKIQMCAWLADMGVFVIYLLHFPPLSHRFPTLMFCRQMSNKHLTFATDAPYFRWSRPAVAPCEGAVFWCSNSRNNTPNLWYTQKSRWKIYDGPQHFHGIFFPHTHDGSMGLVYLPTWMVDFFNTYIYIYNIYISI